MRIAVSKRIETGSKHHVLFNASLYSLGQLILGKTIACNEQRSHRNRRLIVYRSSSSLQSGTVALSK